jgi:hypothetical protein
VEAGRGIVVPTLNLGARRGWMVNAANRPLYFRRRDPGLFYRRLDEPICTVLKVSPPTGL